jgi:hypothetical protein
LATWLAHTFASVIGVHVRERRAVEHHEVLTKFRHCWRIVTAAGPTAAVLILADLQVLTLRIALGIATLACVLQLIGVAIIAARRSNFTVFGVAAYAVTATAIGLVIVAIEVAALH